MEDDVTHISETRLLDSATKLPQLKSPLETVVVSLEPISKWKGRKKKAMTTDASTAPPTAPKKKKVAPSTATHKWQAIWACKYTWAKGEFNANGDLCGVVC